MYVRSKLVDFTFISLCVYEGEQLEAGRWGSQGALCDLYGVLSDSSKIVQASRLSTRPLVRSPKFTFPCSPTANANLHLRRNSGLGRAKATVAWQGDGWVVGTGVHLDGTMYSSSDPGDVPSLPVQWAVVED